MRRSHFVFTLAGLVLMARLRRSVEVPTEEPEAGVGLEVDGRSAGGLPLIEAPTRAKGAPPADARCEPNHLLSFAVVVACGFLAVTVAFALSRSGRPFAEPLLWAGLVAIFAPAAVRLASPLPSRSERLGLVLLIGIALYLVKVAHDPFQFTFADDLVHQHNANEIVRTGSLFGTNSILAVTPDYPGLESLTAAFASMTGLPTFGAGVVVVGAARLVLMLALFLLFEELSGSARPAGLGAVLYAANPNFLFFDAQFSYESLALPLVVVALFVTARWMRLSNRQARLPWAAIFVLVTLAVVITHHMSSYALAVVLVVVTALQLAINWPTWRTAPIGFALFTAAAIVAWLVLVAGDTVGYLAPVLTSAFRDTVETISTETAPRALFVSQHGKQPEWDRLVGFSATALVALTLPFGLRVVWLRYRRSAIPLALAGASMAYLAMLGLRFVGGAWEVGSRASEFLYVGTAFVLALAVIERTPGRLHSIMGMTALARMRRKRTDVSRVRAQKSRDAPPHFGNGMPAAGEVSPGKRDAPLGSRTMRQVGSLGRRATLLLSGRVRTMVLGLALAVVFAGGVVSGRPNDLRLAQPLVVDVDGATIRPQGDVAARWARTELGPGHRFAADASNGRLLLVYGRQTTFTGKNPDVEDLLRRRVLRPWQVRMLRANAIDYVLVDRRRVSGSASRGYFFCVTTNPCDLFDPASYEKLNRQADVSKLFDSGDIAIYDVTRLRDEAQDR